MKRTTVFLIVLTVLVLVSSGPVWACSLCDGLRGLGYKNWEISQIIRLSDNRAEAEAKMRQIIAERRQPERLRQMAVERVEPTRVETPQKVEAPVTASVPITATGADPFGDRYQWNGKYED